MGTPFRAFAAHKGMHCSTVPRLYQSKVARGDFPDDQTQDAADKTNDKAEDTVGASAAEERDDGRKATD